MAATLGELNPFRYRGYYYDTETGFYYLNSRYYDPETFRFLNADNSDILQTDQEQLVQYNLFAYCLNNPTNMIDSDGEFAITLTVVVGITLLWGITTAVCIYAVNTPQFQEGWKNLCTGIGSWFSDVGRNIQTNLGNYWNWRVAQERSIAKKLSTTVKAAKELEGIARKYGAFKCKQAANAMKSYLMKLKQHGSIIILTFPNAFRGYVISNSKNIIVSETSIHYGLLYQGKVYCNVHPYGLPRQQWINDFEAAFKPRIVTEIKF